VATLVFCHGKESGPEGTKILHLRPLAEERGWKVLAPDFRDLPDAEARVARLLSCCSDIVPPLLLVGSSMGGYVAITASEQLMPAGLLLFAPAVGHDDYPEANPKPVADAVEVVHGWRDEVIPPADVYRWAECHGVPLHLVEDGHPLAGSLEFLATLTSRMMEKLSP